MVYERPCCTAFIHLCLARIKLFYSLLDESCGNGRGWHLGEADFRGAKHSGYFSRRTGCLHHYCLLRLQVGVFNSLYFEGQPSAQFCRSVRSKANTFLLVGLSDSGKTHIFGKIANKSESVYFLIIFACSWAVGHQRCLTPFSTVKAHEIHTTILMWHHKGTSRALPVAALLIVRFHSVAVRFAAKRDFERRNWEL